MARDSQIQQLDPCQTAAVQIVEGSDLQAVLTPWGWPVSGTSDMLWLTAGPKLADWQRCYWSLSFLVGRAFDPDLTCLTSWQDVCSPHQRWRWCTFAHAYTHTHIWQTGKYFITLCNRELCDTVRAFKKQDYCKVLQVSGKNESIM